MALYEKLIPGIVNQVPQVQNAVTGDQTVDDNTLQGETDPLNTLWSVVLEKAVDASAKVLAPIATTTYATDEAFRYMPTSAGQAKPNIQVLVVNDVGEADKDSNSDWNSEADSKVVSVPLTRYSKSFGISTYDAMKGHNPEAYITAAINAVKQKIAADFAGTITTGATLDVEVAEVTPATMAHQASAAFGDYGDVEFAALNPLNYAQLIPDNALSLGFNEGTYGIGRIYKSALPAGVEGLLWSRDGVAAAFARPAFTQTPSALRIPFDVEGMPFTLKISVDEDKNIVYHTVEVLAGFALANERHVATLSVAGS